MNVHHLELFYYVARYGGISRAARKMPYGIQQPAISGQISQLESELGVTLFVRRPFALTAPGKDLYGFIAPFFGNLDRIADRLRHEGEGLVRIGASELILGRHLPALIREVRRKKPHFRLTLRDGDHGEVERWLESDEIDLGVTTFDGPVTSAFKSARLMSVPLAVFLPKSWRFRTAEEVLAVAPGERDLISFPSYDPVARIFQSELKRRGIHWAPAIELSSWELLVGYVEEGFGVGVGAMPPEAAIPRGVKAMILADFPEVVVGAIWRPDGPRLVKVFLDAATAYLSKAAK